MTAVRPAWPLVLLAAAACFADKPPDLHGPDTGATTTGTTDTATGATTDATGEGSSAGTTGGDCPPGMSPEPWYIDQDNDGWGVGEPVLACARPDGHADRVGDCNDDAGAINPGMIEQCNAVDDDCDALLDEHSPMNVECGACLLRELDGVPWWLCAVDGIDWKAARTACEAFGADLASVRSAEESTWLLGELAALGVPLLNDTTLWIGLRRTDAVSASCDVTPDDWFWTDGTPFTFADWGLDQPDNHPTADGCPIDCMPKDLADPGCPRENCADLLGESGWNDAPCEVLGEGYVCRAPMPPGP